MFCRQGPSPPRPWHREVYTLDGCVPSRNWDQDVGPAASTNGERDPACPALHHRVGSCLPHSSGLVVLKLQWAPDAGSREVGWVSERRLVKEAGSQICAYERF